jgi:hypothetical protein
MPSTGVTRDASVVQSLFNALCRTLLFDWVDHDAPVRV